MADRKQALTALRDAMVNGTAKTNDGSMYVLFGNKWTLTWDAVNLGDMNAALAFVAAVLPGWTVNGLYQSRFPDNGMHPTGRWDVALFAALPSRFAHAKASASTPALALTIAALNALIELEDAK